MPASAKTSSALTVTLASDREVVLTRAFNAPLIMVFQALSKPEHVLRWFGPRNCPIVACEMDFRVGGSWRYALRRPGGGGDMIMRGVYREIHAPVRFVSTESFDDFPGSETVNTVTLSPQDNRTILEVRVLYPSKEVRDAVLQSGMEKGAGETYDRLAEHLDAVAAAPPTEAEVTITRVFDAPRELVFRAWTDPRYLQRWWGPAGFTNPKCEFDARPGGAILIHMRGPDGMVHPMSGTVVEIVPPERLVFRSAAIGPGGQPLFETLNVVTFAQEAKNKTKLTVHAKASNVRPEAAPALAGMEIGWNMSLDRLAVELQEHGDE
ncbi:MAG TPA: SRPBCC domain-containing protein [Bryobacteraceae bacterium]|nr:SRPBCC domain-containing protein [Bryobacteraceae bacterium]